MKKEFEILNQISEVEQNPFLFTRIQSKIKERLNEKLDAKRSVLYVTGIAAVIAINIFVLTVNGNPGSSNDQETPFDLVTSNQLYK